MQYVALKTSDLYLFQSITTSQNGTQLWRMTHFLEVLAFGVLFQVLIFLGSSGFWCDISSVSFFQRYVASEI